MAPRSGSRKPRIDFGKVASVALAHLEELLAELLPDGKRNAGNWVACNPLRGEKHPSFSVSLETGAFFDHASGDKGGDLVALFAYLRQLDQGEAAKELSERYRIDSSASSTSSGSPPAVPARRVKAAATAWTPITPAPDDAGAYPTAHSVRGRAERIWEYRTRDDRLIGIVQRHVTSEGGKEIIPFSYAEHPNGLRQWRPLAFAEPRPLYALQRLRPDKTVLVVEGEKCADAAIALLGDALDVVTWPGGGNAVGKVDWSPIAGRKVIVWPDADAKRDKATQELLPEAKQPGIKAAQRVAQLLAAEGCEVRLLDVPKPGTVKDGWDVADAVDEGWDAERLKTFIRTSLVRPGGSGAPPQLPGEPDTSDPPDDDERWRDRLLFRKGEIVPCVANVVEILRHSPAYSRTVGYDEFSMRVVKVGLTPGHSAAAAQDGEWADTDDTYCGIWLSQTHQLVASTALVNESINVVARENSFHPIRRYLDSVTWDGTPRIDYWLERYLGVPQTDYSTRVASWFLMGMIKRVLEPGCKFDYCLVLEGTQGLQKSTAFRVLGGEWYSDTELDLHNKDAMSNIRGKWVHEFAEMGSIARVEEMRQKSFLSRQVDEFRPTYGRREIRCPRQLVFGGTTNQWQWNKDPTGGRRFWPIEVMQVIDVVGLAEARDQLLAEAHVRVAAGERCYPLFDEQKEWFDPEQLKREAPETFVELLDRWMTTEHVFWDTHEEFTLSDAITHGLKVEAAKITRDIQTRAGLSLNKLECIKVERRFGPSRFVYKRPIRKPVVSEAIPSVPPRGADDDVPL